MPKNEGGRPLKTPTKTEGVFTPSYTELGINYKDASEWRKLADNEEIVNTEIERMKEIARQMALGNKEPLREWNRRKSGIT